MSASSASSKKSKVPAIKPARDYVQFRAPPAWITTVQEAAEGLCLSVSAFVRLAVAEKLRRLEREEA